MICCNPHVSLSFNYNVLQVKTNAGAPAATNGTVREKSAGTEEQKSSPSHRDSLNPPAAASPQREEGSDRESRSRTLSARSFDPLPAIPKLETAEDNKDKRTKESPPSRGGGDDDDDEAGYAYARVGGAAVGGMDEAESDKDDKTDQASNLPPYGKVSHHVTKPKVSETEEYAEVKEVFRGPAAAVAVSRGRSATDPIEPKEVEVDTVRDKRALTHTHMMPLPAVPKQSVGVDDNEMYDSIPDDVRNSQVPLPQAAAPVSKPRPKERLYESMDEVEDTYESVPDNLRVDSPLSVSSASPSHSPSKLPLPGSSTSPPLPPSSPVPKPQPKEPEKKAVEKTLSASQAEGDGKRRFSFFQRKKTASVSGVTSKKKEKEKEKEKEKHAEKDHKEHHHAHQPLPDVPALSPVMSPPLPPIPANDDEDDTMYDTPQLDFIPGPLRVSPGPPPISPSEAKAKSQSLPSSARGSGAAVFHRNIPLPRVPEDSGQGIVVRQRVLESPLRGGEEEKPYDSIKVSQSVDGEKPYDTVKVLDGLEDINEPNYDTVDKEEILKALAETEDVEKEPGYDRVKQLEEVAGEGDREREKAPTPQPTEGENAAGIRYGKVTRPLSPEEDVPGILPEHDEEGYAVVPEDFKMRKRALSASKGVQPQGKHESPEPVKKPIDELEEAASPDEPAEPSEPYATVDILIKKERRKEGNLTANSDMPRERSVSPVPPPLPPVGDLGEIARDFAQPPIPIQSENVLELLLADGSSSLRPPGSDDPPYAKVKSKDHPYAELDLGGGGEHAKLATQEDNNETEAGYNEVGADVNDHTDSNDKGLVYDTVTDPEVNQEMVDDEAMGYNTVKDLQANQEASSGYDTVIDSDRWRSGAAQSPTNQLANEIPKLELAEPEQQLYDSLEPLEKEGGGGEAGGLYDSLEPEQPQQVENGVSLDMMEEERYEEIDDDRRLELLAKQKQWSQSKSS